jgi:hypothetical protein
MSIKDVLTIILDAEGDAASLRAADVLADRFDAHAAAVFLLALPDEPRAHRGWRRIRQG